MSEILRDADDVQRAHDLLAAIITREINLPLEGETETALHTALDVLCWLLRHDHNTAFAGNLEALRAALAKAGIVEKRLPRLMTSDEMRAEGFIS